MREIKFRAWDKERKIFQEFNPLDLGGDNIFWYVAQDENWPIMQYTGLKDKNGKEIYTGDFVRQSSTLYEIRDCVGGWECQIWKEYKKGGAEEGSTYVFSCLLDQVCEVIGNIYEHKNLLDGEQIQNY